MILVKEIELKPEEKQRFLKFIKNFTIPVTKASELSSYGKTDSINKQFLCLETERDFKFTRIRTSFDNLRPKVIVSVLKTNEAQSYKMKLGKLSAVLLFVLVMMNLFGISSIAIGKDASFYPYFIFALLTFLYFLHGETKITEREIRGAFKRIS